MDQAPLMLSVSGARGIVGESLTPPVVARYAATFGSWLKQQCGDRGRAPNGQGGQAATPHVVLGRDSRASGQMIEFAATAALLAVGCRVTSLGVATTPGVAVMIGHLQADGGMVITASHNPIQWNGIKLLRHDGIAPSKAEVDRLIAAFHRDEPTYVGGDQLPRRAVSDQTPAVHRDRILEQVDVEAIRAAQLKAVVDSVHGAGAAETVALLQALGVELVHLYPEPTGRFPHEPEPTRQNLAELGQWIPRCQADIGFAQDPDADRLAVLDEQGTYIGEEYTLTLAAMHVLQAGQTAVANLSSSRMIDDVARHAGAEVRRTPVGEANVAAAMQACGAAIGGEGNGGVILPTVSYVRDSLVGMALLLEMLAKRKQPLSRIVTEVPSYAIVKEKVPADNALVNRLPALMQEAYADQTLDFQDGVRVDWPDRWLHVRPSNTEPIIRFTAEAPTQEQVESMLTELRQVLGMGSGV